MTNNILIEFTRWFFWLAPRNILHVGHSFQLWGWQYFSIGYLLPRLFSPWHKDITSYGRGFDLKRFLHSAGWNLMSRVIGAVMRLFVIAAGLLVEAFVASLTSLVFIVWFVLPAVVLLLVGMGLLTIF